MGLSPANYFGNLDASNPKGNDSASISDDQHRNILQSCIQSFPNVTNEVTATHQQLNFTGHGGLKTNAPRAISPAVTVPTTVAVTITDLYDSVSYSNPVGVTQTLAAGTLTLTPGWWDVCVAVTVRCTPESDDDRAIEGFVRVAGGAAVSIRGSAAVGPNQRFLSTSAAGILQVTSSTAYEVAVIARQAAIEFTQVDSLNFQAARRSL